MRVLLAHKFFYRRGGAELFFLETGNILERHGHQVAYFSTRHPENLPSRFSSYFVEPPRYLDGSILKRVCGIGRLIYSIEAKRQFARLLRDFQPDLVHAFHLYVHLTPSLLDACAAAGVPVVMSCNDYKHICPNYKLYHHGRICEACRGGRFYHAVLNRCCKDSPAFSFASSLEAYVHKWMGLYSRKVHTYLFASDFMARETEKFWTPGSFRWKILHNPLISREPTSSRREDDYILYFGRLAEEKGVDVLIRAMRYIPEVSLKIVGEGDQEKMLKELARRLGLRNIEFLQPGWGEYLDGVLKRSRFVVLPAKWYENIPYTILQSFLSGKAVIGSNRGGIPELVRDGVFGLLVPPGESRTLAGRIKELWDDPARAVSMGAAARQYVHEQFNEERFYRTLTGIYRDVLS
ncbi:MAG: glycosyltransferase [PVC group bacterium]